MTTAQHYDNYTNKNHASVGSLINRLFEHRSRILVVRIDLGYLNEYRSEITLATAQEHRDRLLDNKRRNHALFGHLLGYSWSLEHGSCKYDDRGGSGYHHHFLWFYDGAYRQEDISLGIGIANYWNGVITNGMGHCYISNFDKEKLAKMDCLGIGMIHRDDCSLRHNLLEHVAGYITKASEISDTRSGLPNGGEFRTFGRSQLPAPLRNDQPRLGRPPVARA